MTQFKALPLIVRERVVLAVIALNGFLLFLDAFPSVNAHSHVWIQWVDMLFLGYFVAEVFIKGMSDLRDVIGKPSPKWV
ncbi:MAG: hypothetical protein F4221_02790, partial [Rhodothermaceae bacterium]|nr:hypothetical protein [Rhodothermaceae bacterium]